MGEYDDNIAIMGDWSFPNPSPRTLFSMMNEEAGNTSGPLFPGLEQQGAAGNADKTSNSNGVSEQRLGARGGLGERIAARAGFNAPRLNTESMRSADLSKKPEVQSPYLTIPPGLSPTTLLDSPVFLSNTLAQPSPTTGKFLFGASANYQDSALLIGNPDKVEKNNFEDISSSSFAFKPIADSASFNSFNSSNNSFASFGTSVRPDTTIQRKDPIDSSTMRFQAGNFGNSQEGNNGSTNMLSDQTHNSVGATDQSPPFDEQDDADRKSGGDPSGGDSTGEDDYNWRKYGQKHVKGSEFPRSYYKCTHPNCPVKKKVERSHEGHITEIIYKGNHNHPKPSPNRRSNLGPSNSVGDTPLDSEQTGDPVWLGLQNGGWKPDMGQEYSNVAPTAFQAPGGRPVESGDGVDRSSPFSNEEEEDDPAAHASVSVGYDGEGDELESKRRRIEAYTPEMSGATRAIREPRVVVQTTSEVDILDDGYRWRKYGQKVVKGNPNPRSYYKCTSAGCNVRKHVERASHDLKAVITTYEGKHNHDVPAARNSAHTNAGSSSTHQVPAPSQIRANTAWFERPSMGSFGLPPNRPQLGPGPGFGYGMTQGGLSSLGMSGLGPNQGRMPALPQYNVNGMNYMLPKVEPKTEPVMETNSAAYQQLMSRMPLGPHT